MALVEVEQRRGLGRVLGGGGLAGGGGLGFGPQPSLNPLRLERADEAEPHRRRDDPAARAASSAASPPKAAAAARRSASPCARLARLATCDGVKASQR